MGWFDKKSYSVKYLGGHPDIKKEGPVVLVLEKEKVGIIFGWGKNIEFDYKDITLEYRTDEQISKDVTLTRLLLVGIFAFGLKKKRVNKVGYITVKYQDKILGEIQFILEHEKAGQIVSEFLDFKRKVIA